MTNYFKMNNYCKVYCETFIVTTAIMSDNRERQGYAVFYCLANQNRGHIRVMLECYIFSHIISIAGNCQLKAKQGQYSIHRYPRQRQNNK